MSKYIVFDHNDTGFGVTAGVKYEVTDEDSYKYFFSNDNGRGRCVFKINSSLGYEVVEDSAQQANDPVNPNHYAVGGIQPIEYMRMKMTEEEFTGFCKGNVIKYVSRASHKNGIEDLRKARKYLDYLLEESESK